MWKFGVSISGQRRFNRANKKLKYDAIAPFDYFQAYYNDGQIEFTLIDLFVQRPAHGDEQTGWLKHALEMEVPLLGS